MRLASELTLGDERLDMTAADVAFELLDEIVSDASGVELWARAMMGQGGPVRSCAAERHRGIFPLPLPAFCRDLLTWSLAGQEARSKLRWSQRWHSSQWARCPWTAWMLIMIIVLNWVGFGCCSSPPAFNFSASPTAAQTRSLDRIMQEAKRFCGPEAHSGKVPKTPSLSLAARSLHKQSVYDGTVVVKASKLTPEQIEPGLPNPEHAGKADLLEGCDGDVRYYLEDAERCLLPEDQVVRPLPRPRVMVASQADWEQTCSLLYQRGIVRRIDTNEVPLLYLLKIVGKMII